MGTKQTKFQPDHTGKTAQVPVHDGMVVSHMGHSPGRAVEHLTHKAAAEERHLSEPLRRLDPRNGAEKTGQGVVPVHGAMETISKHGAVAYGGHHASYLDAVSGAVVGGAVKSAPGYGNAGVQSGHPLAKPPGSKRLKPVPVSPGMRSRTNFEHSPDLHAQLGEAVLAQAFASGDRADRMAHGRGADGHKLPETTQEK